MKKSISLFVTTALLIQSGIATADVSTEFLYNDTQGTPVAAADEQGNLLWRKHYAPFGEEVAIEGDAITAAAGERSYTGHQLDRQSGLLYMGARYYNPRLGLFYGRDPAPAVADRPMTFNRYAYANQNPYGYVDPSGELPILIPLAILAYRAYSVYETVNEVRQVVNMVMDPNTTTEDLVVAGAAAAASVVVGKVGGKILKAGAPYAKRAYQAVKRRPKTRNPLPGCFVAGTLVATSMAAVPIEDLAVGDRVSTYTGGTTEVLDDNWMQVSLRMVDDEGGDVAITQLLTSEEVINSGLTIGATIEMAFPEVSIEGEAVIVGISETQIAAGEGRLFLMTISRTSNDVYELELEGSDEVLQVTGGHPLYSTDRDEWVHVRELRRGEQLQTPDGATQVVQLDKLRNEHRVYNLEVEAEHEYLTSNSKIRAHNAGCGTPLSDGQKISTNEALDRAEGFLGQVAPGVFKSIDGKRVVRMTDSDLARVKNHAGAPHMNFETGATVKKPNGKLGFKSKDNKHIFLPEED